MEFTVPGPVPLACFVRGEGDQAVVFSHSYLVDHRHFDAQIAHLAPHFQVYAYDHRDHGRSGRAAGPYSLDDLVDDAVRVIEHTQAGPCHWVGLSTGGFVGMRLALRRPDLIRSLVLMDTSGTAEPRLTWLRYQAMLATVQAVGSRPLLSQVMHQMFGPAFLADPARQEEADWWRRQIGTLEPDAVIRFGRAIFARGDVLDTLSAVQVPTLVMVGAEDRSTPPRQARRLAAAIPGARLVEIPGAGHLSTVEEPELVNEQLAGFLAQVALAA